MANLLVTTTPILDKIEIKRYIGPLTANLVLGVNFFSDFAASFTDVFGGNSETYQTKLDNLTFKVDKLIKAKAARLGANAIIDYKLQFNEISGKGKQMFMVTATGTACLISMPKQEETKQINQASYSQIRRQYLIDLYKQVLKVHQKINNKDWENILTYNLYEITPELTAEFFYVRKQYSNSILSEIEYRDKFSSKFEEFITSINKDLVAENIYPFIESNPKTVISIIDKLNLFSPKETLVLIKKGNIDIAINLLRCHRDYYSKEDLSEMQKIITLLDSLPDKGKIELVKSGMFSKKEEEIFICPNGHKNAAVNKYCTNSECSQNIKGLTKEQVNTIYQFKKFTEALATVLKTVHACVGN